MGQCNKGAVKKSNAHSTSTTPGASDPQQPPHEVTEEERIRNSLCQLFPDFKPINEGDPEWQTEKPARCPECTREFDFLTFYNHCRNCGQICCDRCCYAREAMKGEKICGICMGNAMTVFRKRELSQMETRMRRNSELQRQQHEKEKHQFKAGEEGDQEMDRCGGVSPPPEKCPTPQEKKDEEKKEEKAAEEAPAVLNKEEESTESS